MSDGRRWTQIRGQFGDDFVIYAGVLIIDDFAIRSGKSGVGSITSLTANAYHSFGNGILTHAVGE